tara:strand:+ start:7191 stop:7592 length:402 start_codon:yes stop_codon:yes gene_type:complete
MKKIEHLGIAVKDIDKANKLFAKIFGKEHYKIEEIETEGVMTSFFQIGSNKIELVAPISESSPISKFLKNRKEGIHHVAFEVDDIDLEMLRIKKEGIRLLNDKPKHGADNKLICFLHPSDTNGVLIELTQTVR